VERAPRLFLAFESNSQGSYVTRRLAERHLPGHGGIGTGMGMSQYIRGPSRIYTGKWMPNGRIIFTNEVKRPHQIFFVLGLGVEE